MDEAAERFLQEQATRFLLLTKRAQNAASAALLLSSSRMTVDVWSVVDEDLKLDGTVGVFWCVSFNQDSVQFGIVNAVL